MGLFGSSHELQGFGPRALLGTLVHTMVPPLLEPVFGPSITRSEISDRELRQPEIDAKLGFAAVIEGHKTKDSEKCMFGAAMVIKAATEVEGLSGDTIFPPEIARAVIDRANALPPEDVIGNRCLPDTGPVAEMVDRYFGKVE